jgi:hypothetical protein
MPLAAHADLHRLIYLSYSRELLDDAHLASILTKSRTFNPTVGVTGLLLYHEGSFIQVIEGPKASLDLLMSKIRKDLRHGGIITLYSKPVSERAFPSWSMGYAAFESLPAAVRESAFDLYAFAEDRGIVDASYDAVISTHVSSFLNSFRELAAA